MASIKKDNQRGKWYCRVSYQEYVRSMINIKQKLKRGLLLKRKPRYMLTNFNSLYLKTMGVLKIAAIHHLLITLRIGT